MFSRPGRLLQCAVHPDSAPGQLQISQKQSISFSSSEMYSMMCLKLPADHFGLCLT